MISVMIVDDQISSRTDIKTMIDWEKSGYYIIAEANNGIQAIQFMGESVPDIVFTDINMPGMNGIDLIEYIRSNYPEVYVIAMSAYDDFDFVRSSMVNGAADYLLKHQLQPNKLLDTLISAKSFLLRMREEQNMKKEFDKELSFSMEYQRNEWIKNLVTVKNELNNEQLLSKMQVLEVHLDSTNLLVTVMEIDDYLIKEERLTTNEMAVLNKTILEITKEILIDWEKSVIVHVIKGKYAIIFSLGDIYSKMFLYNKLFEILNRIRSEVKKITNTTLSFGVSRVKCRIDHLYNSYEDANAMLQNKFYKGKDGIYIENSTKIDTQSFFSLDIRDEKSLIQAIKNSDQQKVMKIISDIFIKISSKRLGGKSVQMICIELITVIVKVSKEYGFDVQDLTENNDIPYNMIQKFETLHDIQNWIIELYGKIIEKIKSNGLDQNLSEITRGVIKYVNSHYDKNISLTDVSSEIGVSASYVSRLFKEECRMGFSEYLNHVRVEKSKNYIEEGKYKLKEIVELVGFNNYNYFFKVFKEQTGMTPLEYENK